MSFLSFVHPPMLDCAVLSHFSRIRLFVTLWTVARQAPLSIGFSRQEYCSGLPCNPPGDLPDLGWEVLPSGQTELDTTEAN